MVLYYKKFTVRLSMRKTQMNLPTSGCASKTKWTNWNSINWKKVENGVKSLQRRIVKAVKAKHFHKAKASTPAYPFILWETAGYSESNYQQRQ